MEPPPGLGASRPPLSFLDDGAALWAAELEACAAQPVPKLDHDSDLSENPWGFDFSSSPAIDFDDFDPFSAKAAAGSSSVPPPWIPSSDPLIDLSGLYTATPTPGPHTGGAVTESSCATGRENVSTYLLCKMAENLSQVTQELVSLKTSPSKAALAAFPKGEASRPLPSIRAWRSWVSLKLIPWCGLQTEGFSDTVQAVLGGHVTPKTALADPRFGKASRTLAFELGVMLTEDTAPYVADADKTSGMAMLLALSRAIVSSTSAHTTVLHERFSRPSPVNDPRALHHALKLWRAELTELREAGANPSKETTLSSLRTLIGGIEALKVPLELLSMFKPDDVTALYNMVSKKAADWSLMGASSSGSQALVPSRQGANDFSSFGGAHVARKGSPTTGAGDSASGIGKGLDPSCVPCSFYLTGYCHFGQGCSFEHPPLESLSGPVGRTDFSGAPKFSDPPSLHRDACRICGLTTDPPHWGNECPLKGTGKGKANTGKGAGNWIGANLPGKGTNPGNWGSWIGANPGKGIGLWFLHLAHSSWKTSFVEYLPVINLSLYT